MRHVQLVHAETYASQKTIVQVYSNSVTQQTFKKILQVLESGRLVEKLAVITPTGLTFIHEEQTSDTQPLLSDKAYELMETYGSRS